MLHDLYVAPGDDLHFTLKVNLEVKYLECKTNSHNPDFYTLKEYFFLHVDIIYFDCSIVSKELLAPRLKFLSCSNKLSMKFILHINFRMPTIVDILTFMCRINM